MNAKLTAPMIEALRDIARDGCTEAKTVTRAALVVRKLIEPGSTGYGRKLTDAGRAALAEIDGPAPLDIPAAVRDYIEAEWCGAALVMADRRDIVLAYLLATNPDMNLTAATFRFHKLVAEMRDNDSIEPAPLPGVAAAVAANDGLPLNVIPAADGLAALKAITADAERLAAKVANVMGDWRGKTIVLASGRWATVGEYRDGSVRLISNLGTPAADAAWYSAETIWRGLEFGTILTPDQVIAGEAAIAEQA